jgi:hypothetical protein
MFVLGLAGGLPPYCSSLVALSLFLLLFLVPEGFISGGKTNWMGERRKCKSYRDELIEKPRKIHGDEVLSRHKYLEFV